MKLPTHFNSTFSRNTVVIETSSKNFEISSQPSRAFNFTADFPYLNIVHITMAVMLLLLIVLTSTFQILDSAVVVGETTPTPPLGGGLYPYLPLVFLHFSLILGALHATELPSTNLALQYVALGWGTQNYSCTSLSSSPVQQGAVATLFNATWLAYYAEPALNTIPPIAVYMPPPPFEVLGRHFFDSTGTPTFDLYSVNKIL